MGTITEGRKFHLQNRMSILCAFFETASQVVREPVNATITVDEAKTELKKLPPQGKGVQMTLEFYRAEF